MRAIRIAGATMLLVGIAALAAPSGYQSWEALLAPYSRGTSLPDGFRISSIRRGATNDVVVSIDRSEDAAAVEVHILPRGCWTGIRESQSFGIGYETPRSPAPQREALTELLAQTIRSRDRGLPLPDAIPLGRGLDARVVLSRLEGWRGVLLGTSLVLLALIVLVRSPSLAVAGVALGAAGLLVRGFGHPGMLQDVCPVGGPADFIDFGVRSIQVGWGFLILSSPFLVWRAGRAAGIGGGRLLIAVSISAALALAATWHQRDEPLHANGHAWREAREVLAPWGGRETGAAPFLHGRGAIALQWALASAERRLTGTANPFRISRLAGAAAAGSAALLVAVLVRSPWAGLAGGCALALMPLARMLAVSGSALTVSAWLLPWSLGLLIAAGPSGDPLLLAGAALSGALGTLSHTAMLAWPAALLAAWLLVAPSGLRRSRLALGALLLVALAWVAEGANSYEMIASRNEGPGGGLLAAAQFGFLHRDLLADPQWVSPVLLPLALIGVAVGLRRDRRASRAATALALLIAAPPFFAVIACSSDAVRYQGALLGVVTSLAVAGLWEMPFAARLGRLGCALLRVPLLAALVVLPTASQRPPTDPAAMEHQLVADAAGRMDPGTLVVLPGARIEQARIIVDFPDFLLPANSSVAFEGDPQIDLHHGPRLIYLGLACISWDAAASAAEQSDLRPECRALRGNARPWLVRSLRPDDLPRAPGGEVWTFHHLSTGVPFGFFAPSD